MLKYNAQQSIGNGYFIGQGNRLVVSEAVHQIQGLLEYLALCHYSKETISRLCGLEIGVGHVQPEGIYIIWKRYIILHFGLCRRVVSLLCKQRIELSLCNVIGNQIGPYDGALHIDVLSRIYRIAVSRLLFFIQITFPVEYPIRIRYLGAGGIDTN